MRLQELSIPTSFHVVKSVSSHLPIVTLHEAEVHSEPQALQAEPDAIGHTYPLKVEYTTCKTHVFILHPHFLKNFPVSWAGGDADGLVPACCGWWGPAGRVDPAWALAWCRLHQGFSAATAYPFQVYNLIVLLHLQNCPTRTTITECFIISKGNSSPFSCFP